MVATMAKPTFAARLRELRKAAQPPLTQKALAKLAGVSQALVSDLEQERCGPSWETVIALAAALGVSTDAFLEEPESEDRPGRGRPKES